MSSAFLHGNLEKEVYMKLPLGHPQGSDPNLVYQLHKSIYGLTQSPRAWHAQLSVVLEDSGFKRSNADSSLFIHLGPMAKVMVLVYVDDLIIVGNDNDVISHLKATLQQRFPIKDLGNLKYFLGIQIAIYHKGLFLNQRRYVLDLLKDATMIDVKPAPTPLDSKLKLKTTSEPLGSVNYYQHLVGRLIYLTITRPDITYAVSLVSQFMHTPTVFHLNLVKRILRYLKGSKKKKIHSVVQNGTILGFFFMNSA
jgi:hypothetical protein